MKRTTIETGAESCAKLAKDLGVKTADFMHVTGVSYSLANAWINGHKNCTLSGALIVWADNSGLIHYQYFTGAKTGAVENSFFSEDSDRLLAFKFYRGAEGVVRLCADIARVENHTLLY